MWICDHASHADMQSPLSQIPAMPAHRPRSGFLSGPHGAYLTVTARILSVLVNSVLSMDLMITMLWGMMLMIIMVIMMMMNVVKGYPIMCVPKYIIHVVMIAIASYTVRQCWSNGYVTCGVGAMMIGIGLMSKVMQWDTSGT